MYVDLADLGKLLSTYCNRGCDSKELFQMYEIAKSEDFEKHRNKYDVIIVEVKWKKKVDTAIWQIKNRQYCAALEEYQGNLLFVGVSYNKKTKEHMYKIEKHSWKGAKKWIKLQY